MKLNVSSPAYVIVFVVIFSAVFTAAVVALQVAAQGRIERSEALRQERALLTVFGLMEPEATIDERQVADLVSRRIDSSLEVSDPVTGRKFIVYRAYDGDKAAGGRLKAIAFVIAGTGFWAPVTGLLSLTPDRTHVIRAVFVEQKETPGLGGRIAEEQFQKDQFAGLNVSKPPAGRPYVYVAQERPASPADPRYGRTIEAITGATQTSRAVTRFLNVDLEQFQRAMDAYEKSVRK